MAACLGGGALLACGTRSAPAPGALAICTASITLRCGFFAGMAAGCVVLVHRGEDAAAALVLILLVCSYEAGDYLVGSGSTTVVEGPAAGCIGVLVATFAVFVVRPDLFGEAGAVWVMGVTTALACPLGQLGASTLLPSGVARCLAAAPRLLPAGRAGVGPGPPRRLAGDPSTATLTSMATPPEGLRPLHAVGRPSAALCQRGQAGPGQPAGRALPRRVADDANGLRAGRGRGLLHSPGSPRATGPAGERAGACGVNPLRPIEPDPPTPPEAGTAASPQQLPELLERLRTVLEAQSWPGHPRPRRLVVTPAPECVRDDLLQLVDDVAGPAVLTELSGQSDEQMTALRGGLQRLERELSALRRELHLAIDNLHGEVRRRYRLGEATVERLLE